MTGKEKKDKLNQAKKAKTVALKTWAKVHKTDETEQTKPDTRSQQEAISDALADHFENDPKIPDKYKGR